MNDIKLKVFEQLCKWTASISFFYDPKIYSARTISVAVRASRYAVLKALKSLEIDGLVTKGYDGGIDEDGYPHCYHGWVLTEEAEETFVYYLAKKDATEEFKRIMERQYDRIMGGQYET